MKGEEQITYYEKKKKECEKREKSERDVRLVFEKAKCSDCNGAGVVKSEYYCKPNKKCEVCNGRGCRISYKIKEIEWFRKI